MYITIIRAVALTIVYTIVRRLTNDTYNHIKKMRKEKDNEKSE
jgi:hypothetical protein